jgi:uncharacterized protein YecE (DUF72 family)
VKRIRIGTAGWQLSREHRQHAEGEGTHLERYARIFDCVEIDSSFYREHQAKTYARWATSVGREFRFAVKLPKTITHEARLVDCAAPIAGFLAGVHSLGDRLGPLIVQLPPSLSFDDAVVSAFFAELRRQHRGHIACEPRHASWFDGAADRALAAQKIARIGADPALHPGAGLPDGWSGLVYMRLHGSPETYRSKYGAEMIAAVHETVGARCGEAEEAWVIFDNTMLGHAFFDALALKARIDRA